MKFFVSNIIQKSLLSLTFGLVCAFVFYSNCGDKTTQGTPGTLINPIVSPSPPPQGVITSEDLQQSFSYKLSVNEGKIRLEIDEQFPELLDKYIILRVSPNGSEDITESIEKLDALTYLDEGFGQGRFDYQINGVYTLNQTEVSGSQVLGDSFYAFESSRAPEILHIPRLSNVVLSEVNENMTRNIYITVSVPESDYFDSFNALYKNITLDSGQTIFGPYNLSSWGFKDLGKSLDQHVYVFGVKYIFDQEGIEEFMTLSYEVDFRQMGPQ